MANQKNWTDETIIEGFGGNETARREALRALYLQTGLREKAIHLVISRGGTVDDGRDIFQEAIIIADRKLRAGEFRGGAALSTWILGIAKWLWWGQNQKNTRRKLPPPDDDIEIENPEKYLLTAERNAALDQAIAGLGDTCQRILKMYALQISMREIAQEMSLATEDQAKSRAYECREKLRKMISKNSILLELLKPKKG